MVDGPELATDVDGTLDETDEISTGGAAELAGDVVFELLLGFFQVQVGRTGIHDGVRVTTFVINSIEVSNVVVLLVMAVVCGSAVVGVAVEVKTSSMIVATTVSPLVPVTLVTSPTVGN